MSEETYKRSILQFLESSIKLYHEPKLRKKINIPIIEKIVQSNQTENNLLKNTVEEDDKINNNSDDKNASKEDEWQEVKSKRKSRVNISFLQNIIQSHKVKNGRVKKTGTDNGIQNEILDENSSSSNSLGSGSFSSRRSTASRFSNYSSPSGSNSSPAPRFNDSFCSIRFDNYSSPASRCDNSSSGSRPDTISSPASRLSNSSASTNAQDQRDSGVSTMSQQNGSQSNSKEEPAVFQYFTGEDDLANGDFNYYDDSDYVPAANSNSSPSPEAKRNENGRLNTRFLQQSLSSCERFNRDKKIAGLPAEAFDDHVIYSENTQKHSPSSFPSNHENYSAPNTQERLNEATNDYSASNHNYVCDDTEFDYDYESIHTTEDSQVNHEQNCNGLDYEDVKMVDDKNDKCEDSIQINSRVKERLKIIIQNHPDGIWCSDLPKIYLKEARISLNYEELGFQSVFAFVSELPDIFHCVLPKERGDYKLYNAQQPLPDIKTQKTRYQYSSAEQYRIYGDQPEPIPSRLDPSVTDHLLPEGVMLLNERVGKILVSELCVNQDYEEVFVVEVFNPSFFWIQLRKKLSKLNEIMNGLRNFYREKYTQYQISALTLNEGLNVACIYCDYWHRGIIKKILPNGMSLVHFYDYGTVKFYKPQDLYYLHRSFSHEPAQAIPCGLYNVKPLDGEKWHRTITWKFSQRTKTPLVANVIIRNVEENSALITLTDTQNDEDFHINDWLINERVATIGHMNIDLKNLSDYDEDSLPKAWDYADEDLTIPIKNETSSNSQGPPPGFKSMPTISEEAPMLNVNDNVLNMSHIIQNFVETNKESQVINYIDLVKQLVDSLKISPSTEACSEKNIEEYFKSTPKITQKAEITPKIPNAQYQHLNPASAEFVQYLNEQCRREIPKTSENPPHNLLPESAAFLGILQQEIRRQNAEKRENPNYPNSRPEFSENLRQEIRRENSKHANLQPESAEFLRNLEEKILFASPRTSENSRDSRKPEVKETNPFRMFQQEEFTPKPTSTNPFLDNFEPVKTPKKTRSTRESLKDFLDTSYDSVSSRGEPKNEYLNTSHSSCRTNPDIFLLGDRKENTNFSFMNGETPSHVFSPVVDSPANQANIGAKIFYESGPVMYNQNGMNQMKDQNKSDYLDMYSKSNWRPIPSTETIVSSGPSVKENGLTFKINKPKSPSEKKLTVPHQNVSKPPVEIPVPNISMENQNLQPTIEMENRNPRRLTDQNKLKSDLQDLLSAGTFPLPSSSEESRTPTPTQEKISKEWDFQSSVRVNNCTQVEERILNDACVQTHSANSSRPTRIDKSAVGAEVNNPFRANSSVENARNSPVSSANLPSPSKNNSSICYTCEITTKQMNLIVLNINDEGWLISDEFVMAFTNLHGSSIMLRALNMVNVKIPFLEIDRDSHPSLLAQLDYSPLVAVRNAENKIIRRIHLTPLKLAPKILLSLHIINRNDWQTTVQGDKVSPNTVTNDIIKLISSYKAYMRTQKIGS